MTTPTPEALGLDSQLTGAAYVKAFINHDGGAIEALLTGTDPLVVLTEVADLAAGLALGIMHHGDRAAAAAFLDAWQRHLITADVEENGS